MAPILKKVGVKFKGDNPCFNIIPNLPSHRMMHSQTTNPGKRTGHFCGFDKLSYDAQAQGYIVHCRHVNLGFPMQHPFEAMCVIVWINFTVILSRTSQV